MLFTIEELEKRLANLKVQVEQAANNYHLILGSKMTCEGFLAEAKKAEADAKAAEAVAADAAKDCNAECQTVEAVPQSTEQPV